MSAIRLKPIKLAAMAMRASCQLVINIIIIAPMKVVMAEVSGPMFWLRV